MSAPAEQFRARLSAMPDSAWACLRALAIGWINPAVIEAARVKDARRAYERMLAHYGVTPESLLPSLDGGKLTAADFPGCVSMRWRKRMGCP